jgi:hypothetical protein
MREAGHIGVVRSTALGDHRHPATGCERRLRRGRAKHRGRAPWPPTAVQGEPALANWRGRRPPRRRGADARPPRPACPRTVRRTSPPRARASTTPRTRGRGGRHRPGRRGGREHDERRHQQHDDEGWISSMPRLKPNSVVTSDQPSKPRFLERDANASPWTRRKPAAMRASPRATSGRMALIAEPRSRRRSMSPPAATAARSRRSRPLDAVVAVDEDRPTPSGSSCSRWV